MQKSLASAVSSASAPDSTPRDLLAVLWGPNVVPGIELELEACKTSLLSVLFLWLCSHFYIWVVFHCVCLYMYVILIHLSILALRLLSVNIGLHLPFNLVFLFWGQILRSKKCIYIFFYSFFLGGGEISLLFSIVTELVDICTSGVYKVFLFTLPALISYFWIIAILVWCDTLLWFWFIFTLLIISNQDNLSLCLLAIFMSLMNCIEFLCSFFFFHSE